MAENVESMVREGIRLYKANRKDEARTLWERATELDQYNEQAWLWLSAVVEAVEDQRTCLENVLFINPDNANAKRGLELLEAKIAAETPPSPPPAPVETPPAPKPAVPPTATSSASSIFVPQDEPSAEEYDDWVNSLNIGGKDQPSDTPASSTTPAFEGFDDDLFSDEAVSSVFTEAVNFEDDEEDDTFNTFDEPFDAAAAAPFDLDDIDFGFDEDNDDALDARLASSTGSGPFSTPVNLDLDDEPPLSKTSPKPPALQSPTSGLTAQRRAMEPGLAPESRAFIGDDAVPTDEPDPSDYFMLIPDEIKPTKLPGQDQRHPRLLVIGLFLLVIANVGAVGLLIFQLVG